MGKKKKKDVQLVVPQIRCNFRYWREKRGYSRAYVVEQTGLDASTVVRYDGDDVERVDFDVFAKLAAVVEIDPRQLLEVEYRDIWSATRDCGTAVIHLPSGPSRNARFDRDEALSETFSGWDVGVLRDILKVIQDLNEVSTRQIKVRIELSPFGSGASMPNLDVDQCLRPFRTGEAHFLIGSQLACDASERLVSALHKVPPYTPDRYAEFSHHFIFQRSRGFPSSFARTWDRYEDAIATSSGKIVARHTPMPSGTGPTAALIVVSRVSTAGTAQAKSREGLVVALLGTTGVATSACAQVLMDPASARELYPDAVDKPLMRAVTAKYSRMDFGDMRENRVLVPNTSRLISLAEEKQATETAVCTLPPSELQPRRREPLLQEPEAVGAPE